MNSDLSTGTLRVFSSAQSNSAAGSNAFVRGVASFGDSFHFLGALGPLDPFVFNLALSGTYFTDGFDPALNTSLIEIQIRVIARSRPHVCLLNPHSNIMKT